mgnify:CR=1 FL=1
MAENLNNLVKEALELKADHAALVDVSKIKFHEEFRKACEKNVCGRYNSNWMGPPAIGPIDELKKKVMKYKHGLIFQTVIQLKSPFDVKGMNEGFNKHTENFWRILSHIKEKYGFKDILPLNAGCCNTCKRCAYLDGEPCRYPEKAFSSVEAYGIDVTALERSSGIPVYNGQNTVSYVALILFNENE